ncbi:SIM29-like protein [Mya arenaria]|uniref:SIM29-like protein n=1 Tax=Mya arenaria TaxID=6604 RepID=A0ABY7FWG1_MYAAR|nr:small integral membrane protein 29-like [Mya arenaria]XP_052779333.1 small integral membrane protein 29-like [Mya arenaria]XP_052779334.1 small integral membrane protein 29-like [Mya arenaria]WAR25494.1 SIM29-like protein [Mya arenaria]
MTSQSHLGFNSSAVNSSDSVLSTTLSAVPKAHTSHVVAYIVIPLGSLVLVIVLALVIMMIFKRNRIERLRHHLMPLYNFEPGEEDWESELLDDRGRRMYYKDGGGPMNYSQGPSYAAPQLQFNA